MSNSDLPSTIVRDITIHPDGTPWVALDSGRIAVITSDTILVFALTDTVLYITTIAFGPDTSLWIGGFHTFRYPRLFRVEGDSLVSLIGLLTDPYGYESTSEQTNQVFTIQFDSGGVPWIGTIQYAVEMDDPIYYTIHSSFGRGYPFVNDIAFSRDGRVYFATNYGVAVYNDPSAPILNPEPIAWDIDTDMVDLLPPAVIPWQQIRDSSGYICEVQFMSCPDIDNGDTVVVPTHAAALAQRQPDCAPPFIRDGLRPEPPAVMFVIDQSGSMVWNDSANSRFTVISAVLELFHTIEPETQVGIAAFDSWLSFYTADPWAVSLGDLSEDGQYSRGAYIPLVQLNQQHPSGLSGVGFLRKRLSNLLKLEGWSTNITIGFEAAKQALHASNTPRDRQFIIFFSDGEGNMPGGDSTDLFVKGIETPTTFTVYFTSDTVAPQSLVTMTENIRTSGYSAANRSSNLWAIQTSHDTLLTLLRQQVLGLIISGGRAREAEINGYTTRAHRDSSFIFPLRIPLTGTVTPVTSGFSFRYLNQTVDSILDTTITRSYYIMRDDSLPAHPATRIMCWPQARLSVLHDSSPVDALDDTWAEHVVQFVPSTVNPVDAVSVDAENAGHSVDTTLGLLPGQSDFTGTLHYRFQAGDTLYLFYRNDAMPLDTIRAGWPVFSGTPRVLAPVSTVVYLDDDADGYIDRVRVYTTADASPAVLPRLTESIVLPGHRQFTVDSIQRVPEGYDIHVAQPPQAVMFTGVDMRDTFSIAPIPIEGVGTVPASSFSIVDSCAPVVVSAQYRYAPLGPGGFTTPDTVILYFSEPVAPVLTSQPFQVQSIESGTVWRPVFPIDTAESDQKVFFVQFDPSSPAPEDNDRLWIDPAPGVADTAGVGQDNPGNRKALLEVTDRQGYAATAAPNPFSVSLAGSGGVALIAQSRSKGAHGGHRAHATILDAVGNTVMETRAMEWEEQRRRFILYWDGRNRANRQVGAGTYLVVTTVTSPGSPPWILRTKIAVRGR
jgi:hypothetical protein